MNIPMHFVAFGITKGRMYKYSRGGTFNVIRNDKRVWGNSVIYGSIFICPDLFFYMEMFDAIHCCFLNKMDKNNDKSLTHRIIAPITIIHFNTLEQLARLQYREGDIVYANTYTGNTNHPKLIKRIYREFKSFRITDGIDKKHFKNLFREVNQ